MLQRSTCLLSARSGIGKARKRDVLFTSCRMNDVELSFLGSFEKTFRLKKFVCQIEDKKYCESPAVKTVRLLLNLCQQKRKKLI